MPKASGLLLVCMTGGGTAGHVTPHFALLPGIKQRGWRAYYIGSNGLERPLVEAQGIDFKAVATGKLRRYFSFQNFFDLFKVGVGMIQAFFILLFKRPSVVFSKGGFVAVPVAWAAWLLRIPVVSHESDVTPGLANRLIAPFCLKICYTFPETKKYLPSKHAEHVGTPIRAELFEGSPGAGAKFAGFDPAEKLPTFLVMGGSQGAQRINEALKEILPELLQSSRVIHIHGKGKSINFSHPRYRGYEFVTGELKDLFALADVVISRAGANSIFEFLALKKPMLLIPLEQGSRGDQVINAESFAEKGWARILRERDLNAASLRTALEELRRDAPAIREKQAQFNGKDAADKILNVLAEAARP